MTKTHISLNVSDVERSVQFYEAFFGVPAHKRREGYANFDLETPPLKLAIQKSMRTEKGALNHLGILVATQEDVAKARERLAATGLETKDEEDVVCCHARQDKVWAKDPDGNEWEVYTLLDDMMDAEACCQPGDACCGEEACCA